MNKITGLCLGLATILAVGFSANTASAGMAAKAAGTWKTPKGSVIRMSVNGNRLIGTIVSVRDKKRRDSHNPNVKLRKRKLTGVRMLSLKKNGADSWSGSLYNTEDGKTYSGTVKVIGANKIKLSGCVAYVLCKTQIWTRR